MMAISTVVVALPAAAAGDRVHRRQRRQPARSAVAHGKTISVGDMAALLLQLAHGPRRPRASYTLLPSKPSTPWRGGRSSRPGHNVYFGGG